MSGRLTTEDLAALSDQQPGWTANPEVLSRRYEFATYGDGLAFAVALALHAEKADHHPDLLVSYGKVTVSLSTHDEGGTTTLDRDFARFADDQYHRLGGNEPKSA